MAEWDCVVVGAGIIGSWTAYHLASAGKRTLILDQYFMPHTRGSSSGHTRIIRSAHTKDVYAQMMPEAYSCWDKLAKDSGKDLYKQTGLLIIQHTDKPGALEDSQAAMERNSMSYRLLTPDELSSQYPDITYNNQYRGLIDPSGGLLLPSRCLTAVQDEFKRLGGMIQDGEKVEDITQTSPVRIQTNKQSYTAEKVVICAGPWINDITAKLGLELPVKTMPGMSVFFQEREPARGCYSADNGFPITYTYLYYQPNQYRFVCTFPSLEYPGMVKMVTRGEPPSHYCHPDERDTIGSQDLVNILVRYVKQHLPGLDPKPRIMEPCIYSMTPDKDYILDRHPSCDNIIIGAGFSGHGYKLAPVVGKLLHELATNKVTSYNMKSFSIARFKQAKL